MTPNNQHQSMLEGFIEPIPAHVRETFSPQQLAGLQYALERRTWRRHPLDIRVTIPLLWFGRFYVVLVGGKDRRQNSRPVQTPLWTPINLLVIGGMTAIGGLALTSLLWLLQLDLNFLHGEAHPVIVPFKRDRQSCEQSHRLWIDGECVDYDHDPTF